MKSTFQQTATAPMTKQTDLSHDREREFPRGRHSFPGCDWMAISQLIKFVRCAGAAQASERPCLEHVGLTPDVARGRKYSLMT